MKLREYAILKVKFSRGGHKWFKVKQGRNLELLASYFLNIESVMYGKLYAYDPKNRYKKVGRQIGYFTRKRPGFILL